MAQRSGSVSLYRAAATVESLQAFVNHAHAISGLSVLIADPIHNLLAVSLDVETVIGTQPDWRALMDCGWLPKPPDAKVSSYQMPLPGQIEQSPPVRVNRCPLPDGGYTFLCDLRDQGHIVLKLAVLHTDAAEETQRFAETLAESCYLLYYRLLSSKGGFMSGRGQYLLSLLRGNVPSDLVTGQWLEIQPPYLLLVFPRPEEGVVALSFSGVADALEKAAGYCIRTVTAEEQMVWLLHCPENEREFLHRLSQMLSENRQAVGISDVFSRVEETSEVYRQAAENLRTALDFADFYRYASQKEFAVFRMFQKIAQGDPEGALVRADAKELERIDEKQSLHYMETAFAWLYYEKNAASAAKHIYVHRNTLDNRIRKITELLSAPWDCGSYCTEMLYSLWLLLRRHGWLRDCLLYLPEPSENGTQYV